MGVQGRVRAFFFRENSPTLTIPDKLIINELVRDGPKKSGELIDALDGRVSRRNVFIRLGVLERLGIVRKKEDGRYHGGPVVELEARNTILGVISGIAFIVGLIDSDVALVIFSILGLVFASSRKIRYEKKQPVEQTVADSNAKFAKRRKKA
jgi:hypothetical protein